METKTDDNNQTQEMKQEIKQEIKQEMKQEMKQEIQELHNDEIQINIIDKEGENISTHLGSISHELRKLNKIAVKLLEKKT